jgi:DUF3014 family protein
MGDNVERWSAGDDKPYVRREEPPPARWWWVAALIALVAVGAAYYFTREQPQEPPPLAAPAPAPRTEAPPQAKAEPPPQAPSMEPPKPLPTLENSDAMMRDTVAGLVGRKAFEAMVYPSQIVRRIVATVDNLPRETASRRVMPVERVPGDFKVQDMRIGTANAARYAPYVRVFESLDSHALVQRYVESYPLFQRAYAELGFPNKQFHHRLIEAIDNLLAAPDVLKPELEQPKVLYLYADPALEARSAGQKIMMRMGPENAAKVKAKLREIRRELTGR